MVTHTQNLCSAFDPSKVQTHTVNTHSEQWAAIYAAAPGEQLGVRCLAQGHLSRGIAGPRLEPTTLGLGVKLNKSVVSNGNQWYQWFGYQWSSKYLIL